MRMIGVYVATLLASLFFVTGASASLIGETIKIDRLFPDQSTVLSGGGLPATVVVADPVEVVFLDLLDLDVDGSIFTITDTSESTVNLAISDFNGFQISDVLGTIPDFVSVSLAGATTSGSTPSASFDADNLFFNLAGVVFDPGDFVQFRFETLSVSEVPLPAAFPLFLAGLGSIAFARRRKRTA